MLQNESIKITFFFSRNENGKERWKKNTYKLENVEKLNEIWVPNEWKKRILTEGGHYLETENQLPNNLHFDSLGQQKFQILSIYQHQVISWFLQYSWPNQICNFLRKGRLKLLVALVDCKASDIEREVEIEVYQLKRNRCTTCKSFWLERPGMVHLYFAFVAVFFECP